MNWISVLKKQERTFVITDVDWDIPIESDETDEAFLLWMVNSVTAKELEIEDDATQEEIEDELGSWITIETGWLHTGYTWHEITAEGKKRNWLNPTSDYDTL